MLSSRCSEILARLLESSSPVTIKNISESFNISQRTVRYDLDKIDEYLESLNYKKLVRKSSEGISADLSEDDAEKILMSINKLDNYNFVLTQKQRIEYIIYKLLQASDFVTISDITDGLFISKATANNDFKLVKQWLSDNNISFESVKFKGIKITADELEIRKASTRIVKDNMDFINSANFKANRLFKDIDFKFITDSIKIAEDQMNIELPDYLLDNLIIHIAIAITRIRKGKDIVMDREEFNNLIKTPEFAAASGIAKMLEKKFNIKVPDGEIGYITIHLLASNPLQNPEKSDEDYIYYEMITTNLINRVEKKLKKYKFSDDTQLFNSLIEHIRPMIYRLKKSIMISNPLLDDIKTKYGNEFVVVKNSVLFLEKKLKCRISDDEIGYLAIHFMVSIQKFENMSIRKARVLVVCATGAGTSKFVSMKLQSIFDIDVIDTISTNRASEYLKKNRNIDLIISTVPLNYKQIKCITVSPFLTEKNISELSLFLSQFKSSADDKSVAINTQNNKAVNIDKIINTIKKNCIIKDYDLLVNDLSRLMHNDEEKKFSFLDLLDKKCIRLNASADSWQDAIRIAGNLLRDNGYINENYVESMIENVNKYGNYILIADDVIMPHAKPSEGAVKTGFSLVTLKNTVYLGDKNDAPVNIIIGMSAVDKQKHVQALHELIDICDDEEKISRIKQILNVTDLDKIC